MDTKDLRIINKTTLVSAWLALHDLIEIIEKALSENKINSINKKWHFEHAVKAKKELADILAIPHDGNNPVPVSPYRNYFQRSDSPHGCDSQKGQ